jgi:hypothetical protein
MNAALYSTEELLCRPIEHTLELMTCRELGVVIGCDRRAANLVLRGERELAPWEERRVRRWLALCGRDGMVTDHKETPATRSTSRGAATLERTEVCV